MKTLPDGDLKCLPLHGDVSTQGRLYDRQRLALEARGAYVRRVLGDDDAQLDPVLRCHLGLPPQTEKTTGGR